jgi:nicotinate phosphoribosyltransferase
MWSLFTDLYEITMARAYVAEGMSDIAVFETFFRKLPPRRSYAVAAGLADVLDFLEALRFDDDDLRYLATLGRFPDDFLEWLRALRFTGSVFAVPEGTLVFPNEPIVQVVAPIAQAQLAETFVLNQVHLQTVLASKAARIVDAARGRPVVDFGSRRAHGIDAGLAVARTSYLVGASGTSNLHAAREYGIPPFGTMAHSFVQSFSREIDAFEAFARLYPETTLLVDTYDTLQGVDRVIELARRLGDRFDVRAIRLDSGDLLALSLEARARLDTAGLHGVRIFASSGLDEHRIAALLDAGAPIDAFGVGTRLAVSEDAPALDTAYKLVEYAGIGRTKLSSDKVILPGRKQVFREIVGGVLVGDTIARADEILPGEPLLVPVMRDGRRLAAGMTDLEAARRHARTQLDARPPGLLDLDAVGPPYPVAISEGVAADLERARRARRGG